MSSFDTLEERAKKLIEEFKQKQSGQEFKLTDFQERARKLIKDHEKTKTSTDCDALINTFKALVAEKLLSDNALVESTFIIVNRCILHKSKDRIDYALDLIIQQIFQDEAKNLLFTIIRKCNKINYSPKIKSAIEKVGTNDDVLSLKVRLAYKIASSNIKEKKVPKQKKAKTTSSENTITKFFSSTQSPAQKKQKTTSGAESSAPTATQPDSDGLFNSYLSQLSKHKSHMKDLIDLINETNDISVVQKLKAWLHQNPGQKNKVILDICCLLFDKQLLDSDTLALFNKALVGPYLNYDKHWKIHEKFIESCKANKKPDFLASFETRKNQSHALDHDEIESSGEEPENPTPPENLQGSLESSKEHIKDLLDRSLMADSDAFSELKQLYEDHIANVKQSLLPVAPEICLAIATVLEKKSDLFDYILSADDLRTKAKDLFEFFLKHVDREGLLVDIAQFIYSGDILGRNLFLARHLLESCKEDAVGKYKLTVSGKLLLAKMCFNREGGLEDLDKVIELLDPINTDDLYSNPEALYMLGECYYVKKRLGIAQKSPEAVWKHAAALEHEKATIAARILSKFEFKFIQSEAQIPVTVSNINPSIIPSVDDNPDSDYEADEHYRGSDSTTTADRDLTTDIIKLIRPKTIAKLSEIIDKNETELTTLKQGSSKKGISKKKKKLKTHADTLEKKILSDYAEIVNDYKPSVRSADKPKQITTTTRPDYEALVHHAAKGELFAHLRKTDISYQLAQLRGMHCFNHLWPEDKVREFKLKVLHADHPLKKLPVYSAAVKEIAGVDSYYPQHNDKEAHLRLEQAARLLRYQMRNMKRAKGEFINRPEVTQSVPRKFDDRLLQAQQFYTAYYTNFKDDYLPAATREPIEKTLSTSQVPFVSTADIQSIHAVRYAVGDKVYGFDSSKKRCPEYDENLDPKHRYVGFVYLSIHPVEDYHPETHHHVPSLAQDNFIFVLAHILHERENTFFADMAANRIRHIQAIKFPSFSREFIKIMEHKYGLDEPLFNAFKAAFEQSKDSPTQRQLIVMLLGEHMAAYHSMYLHHKARQKITAVNADSSSKKAVMLYRTQHGGFSEKNSRFFPPWPSGNEDPLRYKRITHRIATLNNQLPDSQPLDESSVESDNDLDPTVSSVKRDRSHNFVRGVFEGEPIIFEVHPTGGNNNCGFYGLPIPHDRAGVVELLLANSAKADIREKIAHEILSLLQSEILSSEDYPSLSEYTSVVLAYEHPDDQVEFEASRAEYVAKAMNIDIFTRFVTTYIGGRGEISFTVQGDTLSDGMSLLDALVDLLGLHLIIWQRNPYDGKQCLVVYNQGEEGQIHHLLHTRGLDTHFELLSIVPKHQLQFDEVDPEADDLSSALKRACK